jgi:hypothetical protein
MEGNLVRHPYTYVFFKKVSYICTAQFGNAQMVYI